MGAGHGRDRFATLTFERDVAAPSSVLWQAWTAPAARAVWAAPTPSVTVEFLEAETRAGGREVSLCKVDGQPDIRCENGWLELQPERCSVNYEVISSEGVTRSAALVTADISSGTGERKGWEAYRKWLSTVSGKSPGERAPLDTSIYSWKGYHTWADRVKQSWKPEE